MSCLQVNGGGEIPRSLDACLADVVVGIIQQADLILQHHHPDGPPPFHPDVAHGDGLLGTLWESAWSLRSERVHD